MKRQGPIVLAFVVGMLMMIQFFTASPVFLTLYNLVLDWKQVVLGCTFILGTWSLIRYHMTKIERRQENWQYSYVTLAGLAITVLSALIWKTSSGPYPWLFNNVQVPMQSTMFSLLAFFVASASYRAFRAKTREATILLVAAFIILLRPTPLGYYLTFWLPKPLQFLHIPNLSTWVLSVPNMAGQRAIMIGIALGIVSTSLRLILGIERSYLGSEGKR